MAKSQKRSNREIRKPKVVKTKPSVPLATGGPSFPISALMQRPKGKL